MNISKGQQSFSSYSQEDNYEPHPSEEDKFSEYEENTQKRFEESDKVNEENIRLVQKRRYSHGKIQQGSTTYNYLNSLNEFNNSRPTFYTSNLNNLKHCKYIKGLGSPCGIGAFDSSALEEYEKCYLSGLSKYYKSHNYINKRQARAFSSVSSSVDKSKNIDRSEYWNGKKFEYLIEKEISKKHKQQHQNKYKKNTDSNLSYERSLTSGVIVNKKDIKQNKTSEQIPIKSKKDSNNYIKIEQDFSNSKNCSQVKKTEKLSHPLLADHSSEALVQQSVKPNTELIHKNKENNGIQFQCFQVKPKNSKLIEKDYSTLLAQKSELTKENTRLREILIQRNAQIERITKQRIKENDDYSQKIEKLKILFENERKSLLKEHEEEISIYKSVRKEAIKNELVQEEEERLNLIIQKSRIENELKKVTQELASVREELLSKNIKFSKLEKKLSLSESHSNSENQRLNSQFNKSSEKEPNLPLKDKNKKDFSSKEKSTEIPEWTSNFLTVFKNMIKKLIGEVDQKWSDKKLVIIGWKIVKIIIEKAMKLGIKVPEVINENQMGDCSIISYPCKNSEEVKKYNMGGPKKPIRN